MARQKLVNGRVVALTAEEETRRDAEEAAHTALRQAQAVRLQELAHRLARKEEYKVDLAEEPENDYIDTLGDCVDALFKDAQMRRQNGETLHPELAAKLDAWLAVKARHPKPQG